MATMCPHCSVSIDASLAVKDEEAAIASLEKLVKIDPSREDAARRLDVLRVRAVEHELTVAKEARAKGQWDDARAAYGRALGMSPSSAVIVRGLADVDVQAGDLDAALAHARAAIALDKTDAESYVTLAGVLSRLRVNRPMPPMRGRAPSRSTRGRNGRRAWRRLAHTR